MNKPRVLLLWPGTTGAAAGNFGVPQLVQIASYLYAKTGAQVDIRDMVCERALGSLNMHSLFGGDHGTGYDVIGLACYSSYDYLLTEYLAAQARKVCPDAVICAGGYHVSARPLDFVYDGSDFDVAIIGEGEKPLCKVIESVAGGAPLRQTILPSDPISDLEELPVADWGYLARYQKVARKVASQVQLYLSRGCPFDCSFCMERAKRETSWRSFTVERALEEFRNLNKFLNLESWTVYIADALFGMKRSWRRQFLEALASSEIRTRKNWFLIRVDMVEDEDIRLFGEANCSPGFGLESGDPDQLAIIRKAGRLHDYLDRMLQVADKAKELNVPWGANIIVGHPGETEQSMRTSAGYMRKLFLSPGGTTGFLSVDPFRLYPGSPIDDERDDWERKYGVKFHRLDWWKDGDQEFLSEWVDPSASLDYLRRIELTNELFVPILRELPQNYVFQGESRSYFQGAIDEQVEQFNSATRLHFRERAYAWQRYLGKAREARRDMDRDVELATLCRERRIKTLQVDWAQTLSPELQKALLETPRERHVPADEVLASTRDQVVALDQTGLATVSAMHAYGHTFTMAGIKAGSAVLDLGAGTNYGTALLSRLVGPDGRVFALEIDPKLVEVGTWALGAVQNAEARQGSAMEETEVRAHMQAAGIAEFDALVVGFATEQVPEFWHAIAKVVVVPHSVGQETYLTRFSRDLDGQVRAEKGIQVRYVPVRHSVPEHSASEHATTAVALPQVPKTQARKSLAVL
jgi:radical SAM superfamily enzyme YgiQ (UPF0313 family)